MHLSERQLGVLAMNLRPLWSIIAPAEPVVGPGALRHALNGVDAKADENFAGLATFRRSVEMSHASAKRR
jgi:hypothetical protein